ncbi:P-loop NTPase fold protein [Enterococcus lactis]|uniref:P-loop NTPase fold protein n=1 Tax=Enterococcus lactis TaxID=357441 RepID=UPI0039A5675D
MNNLIQVIDNYLQSEEPYALQIDGEWGVGKTYFIKNNVIDKLKEKNNYPVYFSVYGFNNLNNLKRELFYQIISTLGSNKNILASISELNKKFKKFSNILDDSKLKSIGLISDWILESYNNAKLDSSVTEQSIVIFIDDLERISKEIDLKDLLGFVLNELLEKMKCKVIILSNNSEISSSTDFKKIKEKVISRTVKFKYDMSTVEDTILKASRNTFIQEYSSWIRIVLENQQVINEKKALNMRTLFSIIETFDFVESKLLENINSLELEELKIKIRKSIFLNIFVITNEYKLGNIDENNLELLNGLMDTRYFTYYLSKDESKTIREKIIDQYHNQCEEFDEYIFYSRDISTYILLGYMDQSNYASIWEKAFFPKSKELSNLDQLNDFRRNTDDELKAIQQNILKDVERNRFNFKELVTVYGQLNQFEKMDLIFLDGNYSEIIESKLIDLYHSESVKDGMDSVDRFFMSGFSNIKKEKPKMLEAFRQIDNKIVEDKMKTFLESLFNENYEVLRNLKQSGFLIKNNIFKAMLEADSINRYIVTDNNKADLLWQYINSEYLRISNARDFHAGEIEDVKLFLKKINSKSDKISLGRIDHFKIKQLVESLEKLIEHLK